MILASGEAVETKSGKDARLDLDHLRHMIVHAAHLLPAQGPIRVFVHHNTLHAFEHLSFDRGVVEGGRLFGCHPYLTEERFRELLAEGRIRGFDLQQVLREDLGETANEPLVGSTTRYELRFAMLEYPLRSPSAAELQWLVAETDGMVRYRSETPAPLRERVIEHTKRWILQEVESLALPKPSHDSDAGLRANLKSLIGDATPQRATRWTMDRWEALTLQLLWRVCRQGLHGSTSAPHHSSSASESERRPSGWTEQIERPIRLFYESTGHNGDLEINEVLIAFSSAFLDQGFARWSLPHRDKGYWDAFRELHRGSDPRRWLRDAVAEMDRVVAAGRTPIESISESLIDLGIPVQRVDSFLAATLLALRGWAGMVWQIETRGDRAAAPIPSDSLLEYLAVRLVLERSMLRDQARRKLKYSGPLSELHDHLLHRRPRSPHDPVDRRAFRIFRLAQVLGWSPLMLHALPHDVWQRIWNEIESFDNLERRRLFQRAYERRYRQRILEAFAERARESSVEMTKPRFQVICCIDEREESLRRHLEEVAPDVQTFGAAGFFSVPMYYRGAADANFVPLCPVVIRPTHYVREDVTVRYEEAHRRRAQTRKVLGTASHQMHVGSRTLAGGALLTGLFGSLASIPLVARVLFPRLTGRFRRVAESFVQPPPATQLELEREHSEPGSDDGHVGFTVTEMASMSERLLRDIGLTKNFAPLVLIFGHGSESLNNPHKSAYDCGACGGGGGGPNARAAAEMLNDVRVREILASHGIAIPHEVFFVGGYHNTCDDSITFFDLERLPKRSQRAFDDAYRNLDQACDRNAHERCRRFISAPLNLSFEAARRHVEARSEDLAQTRPECGHATNAICFVGRRSRTRELFLDRRCFLTSYDPNSDNADAEILTRILSAVFPVCGGINLEYYFSYVDPQGWGSGTKLPHNIVGLLGVMDGPTSDLRTGLPWQMVEIHEPMRLLFVIETTPAILQGILDRNPPLARLAFNGWIQLATLSPQEAAIHVLEKEGFRPFQADGEALPIVRSSTEWYGGKRDHLGPARIRQTSGDLDVIRGQGVHRG